MGAMHMALLGPDGLRDSGPPQHDGMSKGQGSARTDPGVRVVHDAHHFNEFAIEVHGSAAECLAYLDSSGIIGGTDLAAGTKEPPANSVLTTDRDTSGYPTTHSIGHVVVSFGGDA